MTSALARGADRALARPPKPALLGLIAAAGLAAAASLVVLGLPSDVDDAPQETAVVAWIGLAYVLAGVVAWQQRPDSRFGELLVLAGFATFLPLIGWADAPAPFTAGQTLDLLPFVLYVHVFLAFPSGRLGGRFERTLVVAAYPVALLPMLVRGALGEFDERYLLALVEEPGAAVVVRHAQLAAIAGVCLMAVGLLVLRRRRAGRPPRRAVALLVDSFAAGLVMIAALIISGELGWPVFETVRRAAFVVLGIAPIAFLIGMLDIRLARSAVGELLLDLGANTAPDKLRDALSRALRDPSLQVAYWLPDYGRYADGEGRPVSLLKATENRATTLIDRDGAPLAALLHDSALNDEPDLLEAVRAAAAITLENAQLHAELRAGLDELRGSRARIIEAGQRERKRLERDLHDGAQQRLVGLALQLARLDEHLGDDADARARLNHARHEVASALQELRDVAGGIHPAVVSGHGLAIALESLTARGPVPTRLAVAVDARLPEGLEVAAYYVVSESLANVGKHAQATSASVEVVRANGHVVVEVLDDGIGGADADRGSGLRGLADRVEALGGRLRVWTSHGGGTRVRAEIPCA